MLVSPTKLKKAEQNGGKSVTSFVINECPSRCRETFKTVVRQALLGHNVGQSKGVENTGFE